MREQVKSYIILLILFLSLLLGSKVVFADEYLRQINLDWEPVEGAASYDVEIVKVVDEKSTSETKNGKAKVYLTGSAEWTGKLELGKYLLKVRARDRRKAPGEWSESQEFFVGLDTPKILTPTSQQKLQAGGDESEKVSFTWQKVNGADEYFFDLKSEDGKIHETKKTSDTELTLKLPVATKYFWKVSAFNNKGFKSDIGADDEFVHLGIKLGLPKISEPANAFVRELEWQRPNYSDNFDYALSRYNEKTKKWELAEKKLNVKDSKIPFPAKLPGGKYKLALRANSLMRTSSDISQVIFPVVNGSRSPAAEETATVRQSIDRTSGWFAIASYLITNITYEGNDADQQTSTTFDGAVGGTGRVGAGYMSEKSNWGFLGIADYSGFSASGIIYNYSSLEGNAIYRTPFGDRSEIRQQIGAFYKDMPVIIGNAVSGVSASRLSALGPHYGVEYWQAISAKLGFQLNAHTYMNLIALSTPNGKDMSPDLSYQIGFLGSYRLTKKMTGLAGYAFRRDSITYKATNSSNTNNSSVTGNYLNLFLEWAL